MKIAFCTGITYPSNMANRVHMLSMVKSFSKLGHKVLFFGKGIYEFSYKSVTVENHEGKSMTRAFKQLREIKNTKANLIYVREPLLWIFLSLYKKFFFRLRTPMIYEIHDMPHTFFQSITLRLLHRWTEHIIVITKGIKDDLIELYGVPVEKINVLPDGVNLELYTTMQDTEEIRKKHDFDSKKKNIVYIGNLYEWKGVHVLAEVAQLLKDTCNVIFVGGSEEKVELFREEYRLHRNIYILGHVPHEDTPMYMQLADVLVLPNSGKTDISKKYTSPIKMFEYMASRRPIVASGLPSIREILTDGKNAFLVEPDDPKALAEGIQKALDTDTTKIVDQAFQDVQVYSWEKRAQKITKLIKK